MRPTGLALLQDLVRRGEENRRTDEQDLDEDDDSRFVGSQGFDLDQDQDYRAVAVKAARERALAPVDPSPGEEEAKGGDSRERSGIITTRLDEVPAGPILLDFPLSERRKLDVVVIGVSDAYAIGLFSEEVFGKAVMHDVISQAVELNMVVQPRAATREVIRLIYARDDKTDDMSPSDSTSIELLIRQIISEAAGARASDIHIETRDGRADVFFRINGSRKFISNWSYETAKALGQVLYAVHADVQSKKVGWSIHEVSESSIDWPVDHNENLQLRFSSSPIFPTGNFQIVIRIMSTRAQPRALPMLGYSPAQIKALDNLTSGSGGMVLMVGPTNSGKSTTMQSLIDRVFEVRGRETKVITVEDPVELVINGACQISVGRQKKQQESADDTAFTSFLRGTLRQDPDVVLVGEIRDADSAKIACDLALAGRKVFATLHTNSALWTFSRLREMGVRQDLLTMPGFIAGICYQKLVPMLCPHCAVPDAPVAGVNAFHDILLANAEGSKIRRRGQGCASCGGTGIGGRTLVAEMVTPNRALMAALATGHLSEAEKLWLDGGGNPCRPEGFPTAHDHLVFKVLEGIVSIQDAKNYVGVAEKYNFTRAADVPAPATLPVPSAMALEAGLVG